MNGSSTVVERLALNLAFMTKGEWWGDRSSEDYMRIARSFPPLKILHLEINALLARCHATGCLPFSEICIFRRGDLKPRFMPVPTSISKETLRRALNKSKMRIPRRRNKPTL